jgi:antitoxin component YwqK of YwqJK toxin-antitoxin module
MNSYGFLIFKKLIYISLLQMYVGCSLFIPQQKFDNTERNFSYYLDGSIEYESEYKNGILHGVTKYWDESGSLISEAIYSNGKLHGLWLSYFSGDIVKSKVGYRYGQKHGKEEIFYDNGQLQSLTEYDEGEIVFETIRWTKAGELIR